MREGSGPPHMKPPNSALINTGTTAPLSPTRDTTSLTVAVWWLSWPCSLQNRGGDTPLECRTEPSAPVGRENKPVLIRLAPRALPVSDRHSALRPQDWDEQDTDGFCFHEQDGSLQA